MELFSLNLHTLLIFFVIFLVCWWLFQGPDKLPPCPHAWPFLGNVPYTIMNSKAAGGLPKLVTALGRSHGAIVRMGFRPMSLIFLNTYDVIKEAFVKQSDVFGDRPDRQNSPDAEETEQGIIFRNGQSWKDIRKMTIVTMRDFGVGKKSLELRIQEEARYLVDGIRQRDGTAFDPTDIIGNAVSNIICHITFGKRYDYDDEQFQELLQLLRSFFQKGSLINPYNFIKILWKFPLPKSVRDRISMRQKLRDFVNDEISSHAEDFDANNPRDIIDVFLKAKMEAKYGANVLSDGTLRGVIFDMFAAGSDTTSRTLVWMMLYMITHPEAQKRCQAELDNVIGRSRLPGMADRGSLPYIEATLLEVQRLASLSAFSVPHKTTADTTLAGFFIPKGSMVLANLYSVHYDPEVWDDPEAFRPDRWISAEGSLMKKEEFIPFSIGSRFCLGENLARMELFIFTAALLQNFTLKKETEDTVLELGGVYNMLNMPPHFVVRAVER